MAESITNPTTRRSAWALRWQRLRGSVSDVPILGWLLGILVAVALEQLIGAGFANVLGLAKVPVLFGFVIILKQPDLIPGTLIYLLVIYALPIGIITQRGKALANQLAGFLLKYPVWISALVHIGLLYLVLHLWADVSDYRDLVLRLTLIAVMLTLSLNIVNGYLGEFSCSHPGFMALGAYAASVLTVVLFVDDKVFGLPLLPPAMGPFIFPIVLILGGFVASIGALMVAIPSFRTRGDYLAIISLAVMFIIKSLFENLEIFGGPRGFMNQPNWANLPTVFVWTMLCIWTINNFVTSTFGKSLNAVRDEETAANAMSVNTRQTKIIGFLFAAFWAGIAGGLFAHVLRYINPSSFGIQKLAEVLAMVYFGGLNSVVGSIVGAVGFNLLNEALRPLELYKWIIIPLLLILVMLYRPAGLISFKEFNIAKLLKPKSKSNDEVEHGITSD
jgi:branched-chain amino acid transport system permease protein